MDELGTAEHCSLGENIVTGGYNLRAQGMIYSYTHYNAMQQHIYMLFIRNQIISQAHMLCGLKLHCSTHPVQIGIVELLYMHAFACFEAAVAVTVEI